MSLIQEDVKLHPEEIEQKLFSDTIAAPIFCGRFGRPDDILGERLILAN